VNIGLSPGGLVLARTRGRWRPGLADCESIACVESADAREEEPWRAALAALASRLPGKATGKTKVKVVLSGRLVRWQLLPWRPELGGARELAAYAGLRFRETYGRGAEAWHVQCSPQPPGHPIPACAVDAGLIEALRRTCQAADARLVAATPYLATAFDHWRKRFRGGPAWLGLIEPDCLSLGLVSDGRWIGLRSQRLAESWSATLPAMMTQLSIAADFAGPPAPVFLAGAIAPPEPIQGLPFSWLSPEWAPAKGLVACRMALGV
jgi:hypothetical protein